MRWGPSGASMRVDMGGQPFCAEKPALYPFGIDRPASRPSVFAGPLRFAQVFATRGPNFTPGCANGRQNHS